MSEKLQHPEPHSKAAKLFHWGFLAVFIFALTKQLDEVDELEDFALLQYEIVFASLFLALVLIRFVYMQLTGPSVLPEATPKTQKLMARAVHLGMYFSIALIAISGLAIGGLYWHEIKSGFAMDAALIVHELAVIATYWLIAAHIAAAVYHRHLGDGIWNAMVPFWREPK